MLGIYIKSFCFKIEGSVFKWREYSIVSLLVSNSYFQLDYALVPIQIKRLFLPLKPYIESIFFFLDINNMIYCAIEWIAPEMEEGARS